MAARVLAQSVARISPGLVRVSATTHRITLSRTRTRSQLRSDESAQHRCFRTAPVLKAEPTASTTTAKLAGDAPVPPQANPVESDAEPNKHAAFLGEADSDDGFEAHRDAYGDPPPALDATNAAFLGEADSDDGFESRKDVDGQKFEALDAQNSAFLGEGDSNDGHEAQREIDGYKLEALDASNSAYLGEGDSDDGFEARREAYPEEGDHKITNPEESGLHGQTGEQDQ